MVVLRKRIYCTKSTYCSSRVTADLATNSWPVQSLVTDSFEHVVRDMPDLEGYCIELVYPFQGVCELESAMEGSLLACP